MEEKRIMYCIYVVIRTFLERRWKRDPKRDREKDVRRWKRLNTEKKKENGEIVNEVLICLYEFIGWDCDSIKC